MAFSYIMLVLLVALISVGFMLVFLDGYVVSRERESLERTANQIRELKFRNLYDPGSSDIDALTSIASDRNYSVVILNSDLKYIDSINADFLISFNDSEDKFISSVIRNDLGSGTASVAEKGRVRFLVSSVGVEDSLRDSYYIVLATPVTNFGFGSNFFRFYLLSILFASVFALLLSEVLSDKMTSDIKRLKYRAELLAERKFDVDVPIRSNDEVGELAESIDKMADSIREYDNNQKIFLQNASHELRTPLMSTRGYVEGIKDGVFTDTDYAYDMILSETSRLEKLVNEVMYLSKIETADGMIKLVPVELSDIMSETEERVHGVFDNSDVKLTVADIPKIELNADCDNLSTALTNIITNCLRYAKSEIKIEFIVSEKLIVRISDDGNGINEADLPFIFKRFYKGQKGKYGLGLAIAKAVAEAHDGSVRAYNKQQFPENFGENVTGAVFDIALPYIPS